MSSMKQSCGAVVAADGAMEWRVWAPNVKAVDLILFDQSQRKVEAMTPEPHGYFLYRRHAVSDGQRYAYALDKGPEGRSRITLATRWSGRVFICRVAVIFSMVG